MDEGESMEYIPDPRNMSYSGEQNSLEENMGPRAKFNYTIATSS